MDNENLVFFTNEYPFGNGETFIENEIEFLAAKFRRIIIVSSSISDFQTRETPGNVIIKKFDCQVSKLDTLLALRRIFSDIFLKEFRFVRNKLKLNWTFFKFKTALISLHKSSKINRYIKSLNDLYQLDVTQTVYYSYWMDDNAIALSNTDFPKKICRVHGWDLFFERNIEPYLPFRNHIIKNLQVHSISNIGKNYLKEKIGSDSVDVSRLGTKFLNRNPWTKNECNFVSCSNIIPLKRIHHIIDSLSLLKIKNYKWIHFGSGPLFDEIKSYAKIKEVNVEFMGHVQNEKVLIYFQNNQVDLFINLSSTEGIPVSIMEAYSCGIPALATNVGGTSEIVNNENGILLDSHPSAKIVAQEIENFFSNTEKDILLKRENAYNTWNTKFNAEKNYKEFANIIANL